MQTKRHTGREDKEVRRVILGWTSKRNMQVNNSMQEKNSSEKLSQINVSLSQEVPRWGTAAFRDPESTLAVIRVARFVVFPQHLNTVYI